MNRRSRPRARLSVAGLVGLFAACPARAAAPAFPGAEGYGAVATGGRGGPAVVVTTLAARGPGSLQEALDREGPRVVVFAVSGVIEGDVEVTHGDVTIAGQTAPGAGITLHGRLAGAYDARVGNIVVRHLRVRPPPRLETRADGARHDAIQFSRNTRVMLDHVTASWASDETVDVYEARDLTLQDSTVEESSLTGHPEGRHNYGFIAGPDSARISVLRTLFAHHFRRAPAFATGPAEMRGSVIYDVRDGFVHDNPAEGAFHVVGNVWKRGRSSRLAPFALEDEDPGSGDVLYVVRDNRVDDPGNLVGLVVDPFAERGRHPSFADLPAGVDTGLDGPLPGMVYPARKLGPEEAYPLVLVRSGAFPRDVVTLRTIEDVRTRCGAWGAKPPPDLLAGLRPAAPPEDADRDGIADAWERARGLSPADPEDAKRPLEGEYTALEVYVNELADALVRGAPAVAADAEGPCADEAPNFGEGRPAAKITGCSCDTGGAPAPPLEALVAGLGLAALLRAGRRARRTRACSPPRST
ncbi:MAG TPA: pectate lyase precursor [Polyangiaceae bacterium]|nr:pectate lyase precursor [Polyangiaceae bacterium]